MSGAVSEPAEIGNGVHRVDKRGPRVKAPEMDPTSPILLFDSGVGGLTVLAELRKVLPEAPVIYAADFAGLPYGAKTEAEIAARVCGLLGRMAERFDPRLICIACNTASTIALGMVRDVLAVPIVGTVPAIKPAAAMTRSGVIGVLGTEATVRQGYVDRLEAEFASGLTLIRHGANGLVPLAEAKLRGELPGTAAVEKELAGLMAHPKAGELDTLILACTHFPLLTEELSAVLGPGVTFVDGAEGIARRIADLLADKHFSRAGPDRAITTGAVEDLDRLGPVLDAHGLRRRERF